MLISPQEKEILEFASEYTEHNKKVFGVGLITQAMISEKFGLSKQRADQIASSLQRRGFIRRDKGRSSNFWELT